MKKFKIIAILTASIMLIGCNNTQNTSNAESSDNNINSINSEYEKTSNSKEIIIAPELIGNFNIDAEVYKYTVSSPLSSSFNVSCDRGVGCSNIYGYNVVYGDFCPGVSDYDFGINLEQITDAVSALTIMKPQIINSCSDIMDDSTSCEMIIESQTEKTVNGYNAIKIDGHFELDNENWTMEYNQARFSGYMVMKDNKYPVYIMLIEDPTSDIKVTAADMSEMSDKIAVTVRDYEG